LTFEQLLDGYFNTFYREHPADATHVGLSTGEGRLNPATLTALRKQKARRRAALAKLDSIAPSALSNEQNLDRLACRARRRRECEEFDRGRHELDNAEGAIESSLARAARRLAFCLRSAVSVAGLSLPSPVLNPTWVASAGCSR
jgi:uncharacterized protein (DUF885 family)